MGVAHLHFKENDAHVAVQSRRRRNNNRQLWGLWRKQNDGDHYDHFDDDFNDSADELEADDTNSLLTSNSPSDDTGRCTSTLTSKEQSQFCYDQSIQGGNDSHNNKRYGNNNIFGRHNSRRRGDGGGILAMPIVRPFLRGSRRGFADNDEAFEDGNDDSDVADYAEGDLPSRQDRAAVVQSISQGITGTNDDSLLLDGAICGVVGDNDEQQSAMGPPPNLLQRLFVTRFLQSPADGNRKQASILQLHNLLRKEDWSLASQILQSKPELARTWHNIDRLYGGRYDGEALPIHAACALHPPPSFIKVLGALYPEGLMEKDKSFDRVPLHVACRCLAESSVIRVLCEMDPNCVVARDRLKRVPLHYLIKNYCAFGDDEDDVRISIDGDIEDDNNVTNATSDDDYDDNEEDGMTALKILIRTNPSSVRAADHRGWLPIHVASSCSSRKGMGRVLKVLLEVWPQSIYAKTEKESDALDCVEMAGKVHPRKEMVISLLTEAKCKMEDCNHDDVAGEDDDDDDDRPESIDKKE